VVTQSTGRGGAAAGAGACAIPIEQDDMTMIAESRPDCIFIGLFLLKNMFRWKLPL
jgi:hypothetical protein